MTTLLIGLFGGGALVQLAQLILHLRQDSRQANAAALGVEVQALENAITALRQNLECEMERHEKVRQRLEARIEELEKCVSQLQEENARLRAAC